METIELAECAACTMLTEPKPHCDSHECGWWDCRSCEASNDWAGHWSYPKRLIGNHAAVLAWAAKHGITENFVKTATRKEN